MAGTLTEAAFERAAASLIAEVDRRMDERLSENRDLQARVVREVADLREAFKGAERIGEQRFAALLQRFGGAGGPPAPQRGRALFADKPTAKLADLMLRAAVSRDPAARSAFEVECKAAGIVPSPAASGGYILPELLVNAIVRNLETAGDFEANCPAIDINALAGAWPRCTGGPTVYFPQYGEELTDSDFTFGRANFSLGRWAALVLADNWMLAPGTAVGTLAEFVIGQLSYAIALKMDQCFFIGDGTSTYRGHTGLLKSADVNQVVADAGDNTYDEVVAAGTKYLARVLGKTPLWAHRAGGKFFMHALTFFGYMGVQDAQGRPCADIWRDTPYPFRLLGYPVVPSAVAPQTAGASEPVLGFGALQEACKLMRHADGIEIAQSTHYKFAEGQSAFKIEAVQDMTVVDPTAFTRLVTAAS